MSQGTSSCRKDIPVLTIDSLFGAGMRYVVPMYQRSFAWTKSELEQLIEDICCSTLPEYFLGSLVVAQRQGEYEVVDGQQRLTALFLILCALEQGMSGPLPLTYDCRKNAQKTLEYFANKSNWKADGDFYHLYAEELNAFDEGIYEGMQAIHDVFCSADFKDKTERSSFGILDLASEKQCNTYEIFKKQLSKVRILRIQVPEGTDLNLYFERMNTRAEQLEQADIIKARLMSTIDNETQAKLFASIWNACSDMNGFVQMGFDTKIRQKLFSGEWTRLDIDKLASELTPSDGASQTDQTQGLNLTSGDETPKTLMQLLDGRGTELIPSYRIESGSRGEESNAHFLSIISFPVFLLHVMKVFVKHECKFDLDVTDALQRELDDTKLVSIYEEMHKCFNQQDDIEIKNESRSFAIKFIQYLLTLRYLFDKYIVKRELLEINGDISSEGKWILYSMYKRTNKSDNEIQYRTAPTPDSQFESKESAKSNEQTVLNSEANSANKRCLMIEACLRVANTSPRSMHWITKILDYLYAKFQNKELIELNEIASIAESIAANDVKKYLDDWRDPGDSRPYSSGLATPHIVFHFLDYLLWKEDPTEAEATKFEFKFRNSIEHWYPQHLSKDVGEIWPREEGVDDFGNLCIVTTSTNSKFSNQSPGQKVQNDTLIEDASLKLKRMAQMTKQVSRSNQSPVLAEWSENYLDHQKQMISLLERACC